MLNRFFITLVLLVLMAQKPFAQVIFLGEPMMLSQSMRVWVDSTKKADLNKAIEYFNIGKSLDGKLDFDYVKYPVWIELSIRNESNDSNLMLVLENPLIDSVEFYEHPENSANPIAYKFGEGYSSFKTFGTFKMFSLTIASNQLKKVYFKVSGTEQMILPLKVYKNTDAIRMNNMRDLIYGAFMGVVFVMMLYNLFVFISTQDKNYLYYVFYILFIGLGQITLSGHLFSLILGSYPIVVKYAIVILPACSGLFAVLFIQKFLNSRQLEPFLDKLLSVVAVSYGLAALVRILGFDQISGRMMDSIGMPGSIVVFILAFKVVNKGINSAKYFIGAWSIFITGVVMFVFRNLGILPFNWITTYTLPIGATLEVALLSFALADKINTLQKQKQEKEKEALAAALENEKLIKEQNVILEQKVQEKTYDLTKANTQLTQTLDDLKATQSKLIEQEKMATLGQLTAGIAHEINNPINFVTSNVNPLKRDIQMLDDLRLEYERLCVEDKPVEVKMAEINRLKEDIEYDYLKEEMNFLLKGIEDGAHRTSEIVKGLRIFSRNDEDSIIPADIIEGIESTLVILNNQMGKIKIKKNYSGSLLIDCYPGKLNQVFLNLLSNALFAINEKHGENEGGWVEISLKLENNYVFISFEDNGIGMSQEVQHKIFEPFFTTKPVGQGTGLGMSIVYKTIAMHEGDIDIKSEPNLGSTITIKLKTNLRKIS
ncbi:MAG: sensor histidine kinase [Bacteroidia bacterium]|nr:sensor histidine kinase [Bacteroidia bacterium]